MSQPIVNLDRDNLRLTDNAPAGLVNSIKIALPEEVAVFPDPNGINIDAIISFKDGGGFRDWHHTPTTGRVVSEVAGRYGGQCFKNRINFTVPGNEPELLVNVMAMLNRRVIAVGKDTRGRYRVVGTAVRPATVRTNTTSGTQRNDSRGTEFTIEAYSLHPAPFYAAGSPIDIEDPPNTNIGDRPLALENGLYYDPVSGTGKLGGPLIEDTHIRADNPFQVGNRAKGYEPQSGESADNIQIDGNGAVVGSKNVFYGTKMRAFDGNIVFEVGETGQVKYDDHRALPNPIIDGEGPLTFVNENLASVRFVRDFVGYDLNRRGLFRKIYSYNFNGDGTTGPTIGHDLNTRAIHVQVYDEEWNMVEVGIRLVDGNTAKISIDSPMPNNSRLYVVI